MAQLISFFGAPGSPGMPHVPAFQYWATRGLSNAAFPSGQVQILPPGFQGLGTMGVDGLFFFVTAVANTAHHIVGATVTLKIATTTTVTFYFNDGSGTTPGGDVEVTVANNATAAQCATALQNTINTWASTHMPFAIAAAAAGFGLGTAVSEILALDPSVPLLVTVTGPGSAPLLAVTNNGAQVYGDPLLHRAWRTFVYQGVDPAAVSVFPVSGSVAPDIAIPFWPLHPYARKAFPKQFVNPWVNEKPEG